ncbi:carboxypeptidase-like regulatory domain-containing protein [Leptospira bandrabouensis]|nr:carboxypeptidase-like regulatory domain-containing protein [Leptospira bandrabouensis]MCG6144448.1 carboxypeptidase-like regulatory domain-containing protein [Leptospira bandrabouensis]MCG6160109.1 carboxypeptidase-like regulatory domain-containing protein [Leptospira bandrabouensis]MCG6164042.1 carboxypeptidase-like regulatory domain-containing protein [Leptospira bandrabouensis]MCW7456848.1 carboxypeptidase-like regulatory domain-containing protein [Leptospira bandrabouensis]MCW7475794.1 
MNKLKQNYSLCLLFFSLVSSSGCYYHPIWQPILNPAKDNSEQIKQLGLLLGASSLGKDVYLIAGQIRDPNGVAQANLELKNKAISSNKKNIASTYTTDVGGRFYISLGAGRHSFDVYKEGLLFFELVFEVLSANNVQLVSALQGMEITLAVVVPSQIGSEFDLVDSFPKNNTNIYSTINPMQLYFSEIPEFIASGSTFQSWAFDKIVIIPSIGSPPFEGNMVVTGNRMDIQMAYSFAMNTPYTIYITGIKSVSGKTVAPRMIRFCFEPSIPCVFSN